MSTYPLDASYEEKVYAGVLGKIIGVYAGRPIESWLYSAVTERFGEIDRYVAQDLGVPLVVADDDISGTFTFLRALEDHDYDPELTPEQIGETWLNYLIEQKTVLWWGGIGTSTEHTAYLRLKHGVKAPQSGSIALNGATVAEQIGSQIFIDGWGMIFPGDPARAVDFARRAASVSHDGEAIYGAQIVAALVSLAFVSSDIPKMLDESVSFIPSSSVIAQLIADVRSWHSDGLTWRENYAKIAQNYGYDKYGGGCHMVPNHGLIILALLYAEGSFTRALMIVNTCGWDTDCNSANVGCILGIAFGLPALDQEYDWRTPVQDRLLIPTADGGRCVSDAVMETKHIVRAALALTGQSQKPSARYSFDFPGSVQGFVAEGATLTNAGGSLTITPLQKEAVVRVNTFVTAEEFSAGGYTILAAPSVYPGQILRANFTAAPGAKVRFLCDTYELADAPITIYGPWQEVTGSENTISFQIPETEGYPIQAIGLQVETSEPVEISEIDVVGRPNCTLRAINSSSIWRKSWVNGVSDLFTWTHSSFHLIQNEGTGLFMTGQREWTDYKIESPLKVVFGSAGIAVRVQGMRRYVSLIVSREKIQLVRMLAQPTVLAEAEFKYVLGTELKLTLSATGPNFIGTVTTPDGVTVELAAEDHALKEGGVAFVLHEAVMKATSMSIS